MNASWRRLPVVTAVVMSVCTLGLAGCSPTAFAPNPVSAGTSAPASGTTYFVSGSGDDTQDGLTATEAFRTLQHAADLTAPGDTVMAMDGDYTSDPETNVLLISTSGTSDAWIRYRSYPGHHPTIRLDNNWGAITVDGASFLEIDGFTIVGNAATVTMEEAIARQGDLSNPGTIASGIAIASANAEPSRRPHHVIVTHNTVSECPGGGIYSVHADYLRIDENVVHDNAFYTPWAGSGISVYQNWNSDSSTATKIWIRGDISYGNENRIPFYFSDEDNPERRVISDGNGIIVDDLRNSQSFAGSAGEPYLGRTLVENNLVYDNGGRGLNIYSSDHVTVRFNTSFDNARAPSITSELSVVDSSDISMTDNIVVARSDKQLIESARSEDVQWQRNLYSGGSGGVPVGDRMIQDPRFVDSARGNFMLESGSPAIDAGGSPHPRTDINNVLRPRGEGPDLGAYESW